MVINLETGVILVPTGSFLEARKGQKDVVLLVRAIMGR